MLKTKVDEVSKIFENLKNFIEFKFKLKGSSGSEIDPLIGILNQPLVQ